MGLFKFARKKIQKMGIFDFAITKVCLILIGMIVGAYFDKQETLNGYYNVLHQILSNHGIPYMFYTDRRTVFEYKQKKSLQTNGKPMLTMEGNLLVKT